MGAVFATAGGRKMLLAILGIISMTVLACVRVIDGTSAMETIKWIIIGVAGALAVSDVGAGISTMHQTDQPKIPTVEKSPAQ